MASDGDRQQRHHRLARGGGDASSIVVEDGSGDGGGSSSDDEEDPMRRAVPWPLVPRPLTDEEIAAHRARNKTCAYASSICDRAKLCQPKFMQNRGQCGPLARRFCTRIPVARWSITPGCKECLAPSPKSCEGSDKKCAAARASCLQAKMAVPVGTLRWLSFWDENNYVPADFEGWANFGFTANVTRIIAGARRGMTHLLKLNELFWERTDGHLSPLRLRHDYLKRWDAVWPVVAGLYHKRAIFGFFLGDELVWMGVTPKDLALAAETVKKDFPGAIIWINEAAGVLAGGCSHYHVCHDVKTVVPAAVSWISADRYWSSPPHSPGAHVAALRGIYEERIFPRLLPHQRAILVPGSFASEHSKQCSAACFDRFMTEDALDYIEWASSEPRIVGFAPYHWNNCPYCRK